MKKTQGKQLLLNEEVLKKRFKMYKSRKKWVCSALLFMGTGTAVVMSGLTAQAQELTTDTTQTSAIVAKTGGTTTTSSAASETGVTSSSNSSLTGTTTASAVDTITTTTSEAKTATVETATVQFVDESGKSLAAITISGQADSSITETLYSSTFTDLIAQGYQVVANTATGAFFDHEASQNQTFTMTLSKASVTADSTTSTTTPVTAATTSSTSAATSESATAVEKKSTDTLTSSSSDHATTENSTIVAPATTGNETVPETAAVSLEEQTSPVTSQAGGETNGLEKDLTTVADLPAETTFSVKESAVAITLPVDVSLTDAQRKTLAQYAQEHAITLDVNQTAGAAVGELTTQLIIKYTGAGDQTPAAVIQDVHWIATTDATTGKTTYATSDVVGNVVTPEIAGYMADYKEIPVLTDTTTTTKPTDLTIPVTYVAMTADNVQNASIKYIDDVTNDLLETEAVTGISGNNLTTMVTQQKIAEYKAKGYVLASSEGAQTYDNVAGDQVFELHFTHASMTTTKETTRTIHYEYTSNIENAKDSSPLFPTLPTLPADVVQTVTWEAEIDQVTGDVLSATPQGDYEAIVTPAFEKTANSILNISIVLTFTAPEVTAEDLTKVSSPEEFESETYVKNVMVTYQDLLMTYSAEVSYLDENGKTIAPTITHVAGPDFSSLTNTAAILELISGNKEVDTSKYISTDVQGMDSSNLKSITLGFALKDLMKIPELAASASGILAEMTADFVYPDRLVLTFNGDDIDLSLTDDNGDPWKLSEESLAMVVQKMTEATANSSEVQSPIGSIVNDLIANGKIPLSEILEQVKSYTQASLELQQNNNNPYTKEMYQKLLDGLNTMSTHDLLALYFGIGTKDANYDNYAMKLMSGTFGGLLSMMSDSVQLVYQAKATEKVNYVDSTTGKTIHTETLNGFEGQVDTYQVAVPDGYQLVDEKAQVLSFTFNSQTPGVLTVNLKHAAISDAQGTLATTVTIQYTGLPVDKTPTAHVTTVNWIGHGARDAVTGDPISSEELTEWTPLSTGQTTVEVPVIAGYTAQRVWNIGDMKTAATEVSFGLFSLNKTPQDEVITIFYEAQPQTKTVTYVGLPTELAQEPVSILGVTDEAYQIDSPVVAGYTADKAIVSGNFVAGNNDEVVTYTANTQELTVTYVDDVDGSVVQVDHLTGKTAATGVYTLNVPDKYQLAYGQGLSEAYAFAIDNDSDNVTVHLIHQLTPLSVEALTQTATRTIHYVYADGSVAQPDMVQTVTATVDAAQKDEITGAITYGNWVVANVAAVDTPEIAGYSADKASVAGTAFSVAKAADSTVVAAALGELADVTVTYAIDTQVARVNLVSTADTSLPGAITVLKSFEISGVSGSKVAANQVQAAIQSVIDGGFMWVNDHATGQTFDNDRSKTQEFMIEFKAIPAITVSTAIVALDVNTGQTIPGYVVEHVRNVPGTALNLPVIPGYTAVPNQAPVITEAGTDTTVYYTADQQQATVTFIDQNQAVIADTLTLVGMSDGVIDQVASNLVIKNLEEEGYTFVFSELGNAKYDRDQTVAQTFTVVFYKQETPVDPVDPETPVDPVDPETPIDPVDPETPVDPVDPETPVDPVDPETPVDPVDPETPVDPVDPETPVDPVDPETPVDPVDPETPVDPVDPETPVTPVDPETPVNPVDPTKPVNPVNPVTPTVPTDSQTGKAQPVAQVDTAQGNLVSTVKETAASVAATGVLANTGNTATQSKVATAKNTDSEESAKQLPATGEAKTNTVSLLGALAVTFGGLVAFFKKRKEN